MPDLSPERHADLVREAVHRQAFAAWFYDAQQRDGCFRKLFQNNASRYGRRARECLFELIGADADGIKSLAAFCVVLMGWWIVWGELP